ncbi:MAG: hypothetical protein EB060_05355 [Proteobacteria bacterium]|nr:hypothetical protein [Pseudomonadota bacterium]
MDRKALEAHIRHIVNGIPVNDQGKPSTMGNVIKEGRTFGRCRAMSVITYKELLKPENKVEGLSLTVVEADGLKEDHAWLLAHHPNTGFLIIDATAGQYLFKKPSFFQSIPFIRNLFSHDPEPYKDIFIGTSQELRQLADPKHGKYSAKDDLYDWWSPSVRFFEDRSAGEGAGPATVYANPDEIVTVWSKYEYPIHLGEMEGASHIGRYAAQLEAAGIPWEKRVYDALEGEVIPFPLRWEEPPSMDDILKEVVLHRHLLSAGLANLQELAESVRNRAKGNDPIRWEHG